MDEETLKAATTAYSAQLQQVEEALSACLDSSQQTDLLKLKEDLQQLIELTESSLVSVKKSQLLATLEDSSRLQSNSKVTDHNSANGGLDLEFAAFYSELGESSHGSDTKKRIEGGLEEEEEEEEQEEEEDRLSGTKVRAPYRTAWGTLEFHNAMVVGAELPDGEEAQVRVLYIHPTQKSMKPCPYYLEDKCRFLDNCRFSHGEVVHVSELRDFLESDLGNLEEGSSCLVRHEDGIWYPAKITEIDSGFYTVKFDSLLLKDVVIEGDSIIPPLREEDPISSDSELDGSVYGDAEGYATDSEEKFHVASFGGWEAHTRGIGSKLMLKMGYEYGKGLGKMQEGRVEPVMAVVLPKGKSLDKCAELTPRSTRSKKAKDGSLTALPKRRRKPRISNAGCHTVFDFLNHKLGDTSANLTAGGPAVTSVSTGVGKCTKRSLNVRLFQAAERVSQTEREIQKLSELLNRQSGRDGSRVKQLEEKLSAARQMLDQQKTQELSIQREHRKADTYKKMTEF